MNSFTQLLKKGITVIGITQYLHYENKDYQSKDAEKWMNAIDTQANETESKAKTILTWRQPDSFETATSLYNKADNRLDKYRFGKYLACTF